MKTTQSAKAIIIRNMIDIKNKISLKDVNFKTNGNYPQNIDEIDKFVKESIKDFLKYITASINNILLATENLPKAYVKKTITINQACKIMLELATAKHAYFGSTNLDYPTNEKEADLFIKSFLKIWLSWFTIELDKIENEIFDTKSKLLLNKFNKFYSEMNPTERTIAKKYLSTLKKL